jgi:periplasmic protein CpxP/Spy
MTNRPDNKIRVTLLFSLAICAIVAGLSTSASAADPAPPAATAHPVPMRGETPEIRIKHLHDQLKITSAQELQWRDVAQVMLDNASAIDSAVKDRVRMTKGMTAIDDLRSYEAIVNAHAEGIKKLAMAFKPLYESMPEAQQKNADAVFGHRTEPSTLKKHA